MIVHFLVDSFFMTVSSTPAQSTLLSKRKAMHTESSTNEVNKVVLIIGSFLYYNIITPLSSC